MHIIDKERNLEYDILDYRSFRIKSGRVIGLNNTLGDWTHEDCDNEDCDNGDCDYCEDGKSLSWTQPVIIGGRMKYNKNGKELERYGYRDSEDFKRQVHAYYHNVRKHEIRIWFYNDLFVIGNIKLINKDQEDA